jgi:Protein of unknown function (DUF1688)
MAVLMHVHFAGTELMTGLPEYRNGGLFIDTGVLSLKQDDMDRGIERFTSEAESGRGKGVEVVPMFEADDDVVVEWRAATVGFLDDLLKDVNRVLGLSGGDELSLPQMLEADSWKVSSLLHPVKPSFHDNSPPASVKSWNSLRSIRLISFA